MDMDLKACLDDIEYQAKTHVKRRDMLQAAFEISYFGESPSEVAVAFVDLAGDHDFAMRRLDLLKGVIVSLIDSWILAIRLENLERGGK